MTPFSLALIAACLSWSREAIFDLIREKEAAGWKFIYLGADQDAYTAEAAAVAMGMVAGVIGCLRLSDDRWDVLVSRRDHSQSRSEPDDDISAGGQCAQGRAGEEAEGSARQMTSRPITFSLLNAGFQGVVPQKASCDFTAFPLQNRGFRLCLVPTGGYQS